MVNWKKTKECYDKEGVEWVKNAEQEAYEKWMQKVADENGNHNQDPSHPEIRYPIKRVEVIRRVRPAREGGEKEYITTSETWIGIDGLHNPEPLSLRNPQCYDKPIFVTMTRPRRDSENQFEKYKSTSESVKVYDETFSKKAAEEYLSRANKMTVSMVVWEEGRGRNPVAVHNFDDLVSRDFDDLMTGKPAENSVRKQVKKEREIEKEIAA